MNDFDQLQEQLRSLEKMSAEELCNFSQKHGEPLKCCRSRKLLRKKVSFLLQAKQFGDIPAAIRKQTYDIGLGLPHIKNAKGFLIGTTFIRKWKGETYRLVAVADGFEMDGQKFKSLSGAAMAVTGAQWSGTIFWKVK